MAPNSKADDRSQDSDATRTVRARRWEPVLGLFTEVRAGEGPTGLILLLNIFLVLAAYFMIKPLREGWLAVSELGSLSKLELKAYSSLAQSLLLLGTVPLYAWIAMRVRRRNLVMGTSAFIALQLGVFWLLHPDRGGPAIDWLGILFYLWVGMFSVTLVAQFWSFAADLYSVERGQRIFPLIAIGATGGSVAGSWFSQHLVRLQAVSAHDLLLVAILPIMVAPLLTLAADRRGQTGRARFPERRLGPAAPKEIGPYRLIRQNKYLFHAALLALLISWVNTNGENILFGLVQQSVAEQAGSQGLTEKLAVNAFTKERMTAFYGDLYFWVNLLSLVLQAFVASRVVKYGGFTAILFLTPIVSLLSYGLMALFPALAVVRLMKIVENSHHHSVNNTARQMLWLPTSPTQIYKAKAAVDTVFVRVGDGLAALTVLVSTRLLPVPLLTLLLFNLGLVIVWSWVAWVLSRENERLVEQARAGT